MRSTEAANNELGAGFNRTFEPHWYRAGRAVTAVLALTAVAHRDDKICIGQEAGA